MIEVYLRDPVMLFTDKDIDSIASRVTSSAISADGKWLMFCVPVVGGCEIAVIDFIAKTHLNASRKYAEGTEVFANVELDSVESIGLEDVQGLDEEE